MNLPAANDKQTVRCSELRLNSLQVSLNAIDLIGYLQLRDKHGRQASRNDHTSNSDVPPGRAETSEDVEQQLAKTCKRALGAATEHITSTIPTSSSDVPPRRARTSAEQLDIVTGTVSVDQQLDIIESCMRAFPDNEYIYQAGLSYVSWG